ncbi:MAG TPA: hypothetical protein VMW10_00400 [Alphaproteobacteria bacterium]|nr:hypothetical protein [Alphaproteobacteria bacterium]
MDKNYLISAAIGAAMSLGGVWAVSSIGDDTETTITDFKKENQLLRDSIDVIRQAITTNALIVDSLEVVVDSLHAQKQKTIIRYEKIRSDVNDADILQLDSIIRSTITVP